MRTVLIGTNLCHVQSCLSLHSRNETLKEKTLADSYLPPGSTKADLSMKNLIFNAPSLLLPATPGHHRSERVAWGVLHSAVSYFCSCWPLVANCRIVVAVPISDASIRTWSPTLNLHPPANSLSVTKRGEPLSVRPSHKSAALLPTSSWSE